MFCTKFISVRTSFEVAFSLIIKFACFSLINAPPTRNPLSPTLSISRPALSPLGFENTHPALQPPGWFARLLSITSLIFASICFSFFCLSKNVTDKITIPLHKSSVQWFSLSTSCGLIFRILPFLYATICVIHSKMFVPKAPAFITTIPPIVAGMPNKFSRPERPLFLQNIITWFMFAPELVVKVVWQSLNFSSIFFVHTKTCLWTLSSAKRLLPLPITLYEILDISRIFKVSTNSSSVLGQITIAVPPIWNVVNFDNLDFCTICFGNKEAILFLHIYSTPK